VPATSTSLAFVEAVAALGVEEVSVVAPYPREAADSFAAFLGEWGIGVRATVALGLPGASSSERLTAADVEREIERLDQAVPVLLPDTAVWGIEILRELAPRLRAPLLVANQVTLWQAFELAGLDTDLPAFDLLAKRPAPGVTRSASLLGNKR
jgi:maleate cis-trans isomerase